MAKQYGNWRIQTSKFYSIHNKKQHGYWFGLETIKNWDGVNMWLNHVSQKLPLNYDIDNLRIALNDIFQPLQEPFTKQAIRNRIKSLLKEL